MQVTRIEYHSTQERHPIKQYQACPAVEETHIRMMLSTDMVGPGGEDPMACAGVVVEATTDQRTNTEILYRRRMRSVQYRLMDGGGTCLSRQ